MAKTETPAASAVRNPPVTKSARDEPVILIAPSKLMPERTLEKNHAPPDGVDPMEKRRLELSPISRIVTDSKLLALRRKCQFCKTPPLHEITKIVAELHQAALNGLIMEAATLGPRTNRRN
ncbi:hypothetical protein [Amphiplicatus metriothermophilus]|uniref:hypothetical protein n=1 Tax=Amphiplicatus metriothermophilus TaxID=1519374 RepID=UPI0011773EB3|nr:hypothetical protein [Amphiplicatus metriothermophilus]MBB5518343.1 hypothetical protein [Amphiplicatus metriothermophilus]